MRRVAVWAAVACGLWGCGASERVVPVAPLLLVEPASVSFGEVPVLHAVERTVRVTNGGRAPLRLEELKLEGGEGAFEAAWVEPDRPLRAGESRGMVIRFLPLTPGKKAAGLGVRENAPSAGELRVGLDGEGLPLGLRLSVPALSFGRIELESEKARTLVVENISSVPLKPVTSLVGAGSGEYVVWVPPLAAGEARELEVHFRPSRVGRLPTALTVRACPACPPEVVWMEGEGLEQAVVAEPPDVSLGAVALDQAQSGALRLRNLSTEPFTLTGASLLGRGELSFGLTPPPFPRVLAPGATLEIPVRFSPGHAGQAETSAFVSVTSRRHPTTDFRLRAWGGAAELCVSPEGHDFGLRPVGSRTSVAWSLRHCGSGNAGPLELTELSLGQGAQRVPGFSLVSPAVPARLKPGEELTARVRFEPEAAGPAAGTLHVRTGGAAGGHLTWPLTGEGELLPPCTLAVTPREVDFSLQSPGAAQVLGVKVENAGSTACAVKDVRVLDAAGGVFSLPGGELEGLVLGPTDSFSFMVGFTAPPGVQGAWTGAVGFTQANPAEPLRTVPLRAQVGAPCLAWTPGYVDFGLSRPDCPAPVIEARLENRCTGARTVRAVRLGTGTTDGEFELQAAPAVPLALAPGAWATVRVRYRGQVPGMNLSPLLADVEGEPLPLEATLVGESSPQAHQVDRWVQADARKVDVLLVVDNTASMVEEQPRLGVAVPALVTALRQRGVDFHLGVTTTGLLPAGAGCPGGGQGGEAGRLFPVDGSLARWVTGAMADAAARAQQLVQVGQCAQVERGMEALQRALAPPLVDQADDPATPQPADGNAGFLRADATLAVIAISDEDDHSPGAVDTYARFLAGLKGAGQGARSVVHAVVPSGAGCATAGGAAARWEALVQRTGGELLTACAPDYGPLMATVGARAGAPADRFPLSYRPDPTTLEVTVEGRTAQGWRYEPVFNEVSFAVPPAAGSRVEVAYDRACGGAAP